MDPVQVVLDCLEWMKTINITLAGVTVSVFDLYLTLFILSVVVGLIACILSPGNVDLGG